VVALTEDVEEPEKVVVGVAVCETDADTELEPLPEAATVPVTQGEEESEVLGEGVLVRSMVEDTLPESDAEPQGVGVIEGVYEYEPVPDRLAVVVADGSGQPRGTKKRMCFY
jgi:hypothetical protein